MQTRNRNTFTTIHTEGALLPVDLLQRISENNKNLEGLNPESYHLAPGEKLNEAINRSWNRLSGLWGAFQAARGRLGSTDAGTTLTRERWLLPLFQELGFGRLSTSKAVEIEGKSYPISHRWLNVPLHLVGCGIELDKRTPGAAGAARTSPHSLMQEYLNRSDDVQWGVISNGLGLRILRDNATLTRQAYIEFDLESMFDGEIYADFVLLWLICHQSRFETTEKQTECLLEKWSKSAQESGTRALDDLRRGVEEAIVSFGQGFLQHPMNGELRNRLKNGDLAAQDYYRQLLRLVYRLIFLFAAEDRDLLLLPGAAVEARQRFQNYYSTTRLRALAQKQRGSRHHDRYEALRLVMTLLGSDLGCPELAIPALGGFLFDARSTADLNDAKLDNQALLSAVRSLAFITEGNTRRAVDYRNLGPEELGSVYESLLELHPMLNTDAGTFQLTSAAGNERKTTGSYYTPSSLIQVLLDSALDPVIQDRLKGKQDAAQQEQALLDLKVCDPACGSGHFLIAAAHRIAGKLAEVRAGDNEPSPNETRRALRDVIRHCIYGVDINPMAVELCKVNLWLESLEPGKPLTFLDAHIQCGDSLVGVGPGMDISEIPDEAFTPVFGDDKITASAFKKRNKAERGGQLGFRWKVNVLTNPEDLARWRSERAGQLEAMPEDDPVQVQAKAQAFERYQKAQEYIQNRLEYDLWTTAFFWAMPKGDAEHMLAPTQQELTLLRSGGAPDATLVDQVHRLAEEVIFFHWELAFPQVFVGRAPGFDCVLGNPPWERIKLQEEEFFASREARIADAPNKAIRQKMINDLSKNDPHLAQAFSEAKHSAECTSKFVRISERFPLTAVGDVNTYALFAELFRKLMSDFGLAGMIIPTGIATDDPYKDFFSNIVTSKSLVSLYDFENRDHLFATLHTKTKFCLLTLSNKESKEAEFCFLSTKTEDLRDKMQVFTLLAEDFSLFNPNSNTCPLFRTRIDAELTRRIFQTVPIMVNDLNMRNPWGIKFIVPFHMANDSQLFMTSPSNKSLPLYEAKMFWHFDHRWATYRGTETHLLNDDEKRNQEDFVTPRYWVNKDYMKEKIKGRSTNRWLICMRNITDSRNERTAVFAFVPFVAVGSSASVVLVDMKIETKLVTCLVANTSALVFDYAAKQKVAGTNFSQIYVKQLPTLPPTVYSQSDINYIAERVLELVYSATDLFPYAEDMGYHGEPFRWDVDRRTLLRADLDAYYARLYGLNRKQLRYILDPADLTPRELENILDPWEEVADPLDPVGYAQRVAASDFPGETFRVLKEKEIKQYSEYRTRRLVLEAWDRLEGVEVGNPDGYPAQSAAVLQKQETILVTQPKSENRPVAVQTQLPATAKPPSTVTPQPKVVKEIVPPADQPTLTDFGLYKCEVCGKMVMGFEKANHEREIHGGKSVEWKKVR